MKIGVISDTHGDWLSIERAIARAGKVDMWLHAGDLSQDGRFLAELSGVPVTSVAGNCDGHTAAKPDEFIESGGVKIWLTHGHRYNVRDGHRELLFWAQRYEVQTVVYGHTHIPETHWDQDVLVFNPGSASRPRGGFPASFGILEITSAGLVVPETIQI